MIKEGRKVIGVRFLSKTHSNGSWLVSHKVFESSSGHIVVEESAEVVGI